MNLIRMNVILVKNNSFVNKVPDYKMSIRCTPSVGDWIALPSGNRVEVLTKCLHEAENECDITIHCEDFEEKSISLTAPIHCFKFGASLFCHTDALKLELLNFNVLH